MTRYKIIYDREGCIGAAACAAVSPKYWKMVEDGKANLIGSEKVEGKEEYILEIDDTDFEEMFEAAQSCPVIVIHIINLDTGEKII